MVDEDSCVRNRKESEDVFQGDAAHARPGHFVLIELKVSDGGHHDVNRKKEDSCS